MMQKILLAFLVFALLLEGTITSLPLVLLMLIFIATRFYHGNIFAIAFFAGLILDVMLVRHLGETSVYFLLILFLICMYERKYEISSPLFVTIITFVASCIYYFIFPVPQSFVQIVVATVLAFIGFSLVKQLERRTIPTARL